MKIKNTPQRAISPDGEAWYYENKNSIQIYIQSGGKIYIGRIRRAKLADWIKRTGGVQ